VLYSQYIGSVFCFCFYQAKQQLGSENCSVRFQALLSSLSLPPAFTTLRLNTCINSASVLCAEVAEQLREVQTIHSVTCVGQYSRFTVNSSPSQLVPGQLVPRALTLSPNFNPCSYPNLNTNYNPNKLTW